MSIPMHNAIVQNCTRDFHWLIHDVCNYRCPYCPRAGAARKSGPWKVNPHPPEVWIEAWRRVYDKYGACNICITGGEPTIFSDFISFLAVLTQWHKIDFDTNLSWSIQQLDLFSSRISKDRVKVNLSFHPHSVSSDSFIEKAVFLKERDFKCICRLVAFPPLLPKIESYAEEFGKAGLWFVVTPFGGTYGGLKYPQEYNAQERQLILDVSIRFAEKHAEYGLQASLVKHVLDSHLNSTLGKSCKSGNVYSFVEHDGTVYRCMLYGGNNLDPLGNILNENFQLNAGAAPCKLRVCEYECKYLEDSALFLR